MKYHIDECILRKSRFNFSDSKKEKFDIVYGVDENYCLGVAISITSLIINNNIDFRFHVFTNNTSAEYEKRISLLAERYSSEIIIYFTDINFFKQLPSTEVWSSAMYLRFLGLDVLSSEYERALYLDADVMCKGSIALLKEISFDNCIAAVIIDIISPQKKSGNIFPENIRYFNSGVMLVNLKQWRLEKVTERSLNMLTDANIGEKIKYPDQDVLNIILHKHTKILPRKYNTIYSLKSELADSTHIKFKNVIGEDTALIHYTGITKPWHDWANYPSAKPFQLAFDASPWAGEKYVPARKLSEWQKKYKHEFCHGKILSGVISCAKYNFLKLKRRKV